MQKFVLSRSFRIPLLWNQARSWPKLLSSSTEQSRFEKVYLHVSGIEKRNVINGGASWDNIAKKWYVYRGTPEFQKCIQYHRTYLPEPHDEKYRPNKFARWDYKEKKWFVTGGFVFSNSDYQPPINKPDESIVKPIEPHQKAVIFDIETNGLPDFTKLLDDDSRYHCSRIVQMSYLLCNCSDLTPVQNSNPEAAVGDVIIRSDGFFIDNAEIHGITLERSISEGLPFKKAIEKLKPHLLAAQYIVAHNAAFDVPILRSELLRYGELELLKHVDSMTVVCSMKKTTPLMKLRGNNHFRFKSPSMKELYSYATGEAITKQHDAKYDVLNLHKALKKLFDDQKIEVNKFFNGVVSYKDNLVPKEE